eukprot:scaffold97595_cov22-Tisochrysis_lutea.AAC.1
MLHLGVLVEDQGGLTHGYTIAGLYMPAEACQLICSDHVALMDVEELDIGIAGLQGQTVLPTLCQPVSKGQDAVYRGIGGQAGGIVGDGLCNALHLAVMVQEGIMVWIMGQPGQRLVVLVEFCVKSTREGCNLAHGNPLCSTLKKETPQDGLPRLFVHGHRPGSPVKQVSPAQLLASVRISSCALGLGMM